MLPLRYARRWRTASIVLLVLVLAATLMPAIWFWPQKVGVVSWFVHADKWLHGLTFVLLAVWFAGQYQRRTYWLIGLGLIAFGAAIEVCQRMLSYRSAEVMDMAANGAGIVVGLGIALAGLGGWSLRVENWLAPAVARNDGD